MLKLEKISYVNGNPVYFISCDEKILNCGKVHSAIIKDNDEEMFCKNTNVTGVYSFGVKQLVDGMYHEAGYIWSSRPGCINGRFNMQLVDAVINGSSRWAVDINTLKPLVEAFTNKLYTIEKYYNFYDKRHEEPCYKLVEKLV